MPTNIYKAIIVSTTALDPSLRFPPKPSHPDPKPFTFSFKKTSGLASLKIP